MIEKEPYRGFLLIQRTYSVRCQNCGWRGKAVLGEAPIVTDEHDGADWCPVCGALALVGDDGKGSEERDR